MKHSYVVTFKISRAEQGKNYTGLSFDMTAEIDDEASAQAAALAITSHIKKIWDEFKEASPND